jgi:DNA invertase Pin-like site-specific DNA recombinase
MSDQPRAYSYVRMSTPEQLKGHSKQRQLESSAAYATAHGLDLVEGGLEDLGVSAFKGDNISTGALGGFLDAVEQRLVPAGSYLLVESLDRITRQEIVEALTLFLRIIKAGINLVTLQDNRVYRADQVDFQDLIISLTIMSRAHEESQLKSQRVGAAWANKRVRAETKSQPQTKWCPAWLRLSNDRSRYEIVLARADVIRSIFEESVAGIGIFKISKRLNERRVPLMGKSNGWHPSYVAKILSNRAVIGEYQPHKLVGGKRKPVSDPIKDYFPRVIDDDLFYRAQQSRSERRISGRGRKGTYLTNLFSGLATCAYCRSPMKFENKGPPPKGGTFLVCEASKRGMGCVTTGWRYEQFESSFLAFVEQIDLGERTYVLADGSKVPSQTFRIRSLKVGNQVLENVNGSIASVNGSLLLGQSFLGRFRSWSVDNSRHALLLSE